MFFPETDERIRTHMIHCPECGREIPEEDFNVSSDLAYCRGCKTNHSYAELARAAGEERLFRADLPPHGIRVEAVPPYEEVLCFRYYSHTVWVLCFFCLFWCGAVAGFTSAVWFGSGAPWPMKLFLIPFQLVGLGILGGTVMMLFGKGELRINGGRLEVFSGIGRFGVTRVCELSEIGKVAVEATGIRQNDTPVYGVAIRPGNGRKRFIARNLDREKQEFIMNFIKHHIQRNDARGKGFWA